MKARTDDKSNNIDTCVGGQAGIRGISFGRRNKRNFFPTKGSDPKVIPVFSSLVFSPLGACLPCQAVSNFNCIDFFLFFLRRNKRGKQRKTLPVFPWGKSKKKATFCCNVDSRQSFFLPHSAQITSKVGDVSIPQNLQTQPQLTPAKETL